MNNEYLIQPINESTEVEYAFTLVTDMVHKPEDLNLEWSKQHDWTIAILEGACHFNEYDAENLAKAFSLINCIECLAIATEPLKNSILCYKVKATTEGLLAFSWECGSFDFILTSKDRNFAVMCTVNDYYLVAGQRDFVVIASGGSILKAKQKFLSFIQDESWNEKTRQFFLKIFSRYEKFYR